MRTSQNFRTKKITFEDISVAIEQVRNGDLGKYDTPSDTTYLQCNRTFEVWDFKPVIGRVLENVGLDPKSFGWVTTTFQPQVLRLGFNILKFQVGKGRKLGLRGFDVNELGDTHYWLSLDPEGVTEQTNEADEDSLLLTPSEHRLTHQRVRNSAIAQEVRLEADRICDACSKRSFQTRSGYWFVEVHHKKWLREGGLDVIENLVALCPNCHRQEHHGKKRRYF